MAESNDVELLNRVRAALAPRTDLRLAIAFGSRTKGRARRDSDLDLAVLGHADVLGLGAELAPGLGVGVDVVALEAASIPLVDAILREGVTVFEATPGVAASWRSKTLADLELDRPWFERMRDAWLNRVAERGLGGQ